jgi:hypothetical protein
MFTLRKEHMDALAQATLDRFAADMYTHLKEAFPASCESMGEAGVQEQIQYGISKAKSYEIEMHRDICRYIDLMFTFGRDFDTDPKVEWAGRILNDHGIPDPATRIDQLYTEAGRNMKG